MRASGWRDMGLVLAAGAGRRYGEPKAAVLWQGER
jgi:CTP:molybdopterin cytidylyltransferase MocA